jgi:hypothetical protein
MIKKNILGLLVMLLAFSMSTHAMTQDEFEKISDKIVNEHVGIDKEGKLAAQKKRDNRKFWIIAGGAAIVSFAVGAAVVAFYCDGKVNKLAGELDKTNNSLINFDGDQGPRISRAQKRIKELESERERLLSEDSNSQDVKLIELEIDRQNLDLQLVLNIEARKTDKDLALIDMQIDSVRQNGIDQESIEIERLVLEKKRLEWSREKYCQSLFRPDDQDWLKSLHDWENELNEIAQKLDNPKQQSNIGSTDYSSEEEGDTGFGLFD